MTTEIRHFDDLLRMAHEQPDRQRLLFVFVGSELPENATTEQRVEFESGEGGALVPLMCADKLPEELESFATLTAEAQEFEHPSRRWRLVFAAALGGSLSAPPSEDEAEPALDRMIEAIKMGMTDSYLPFNRSGEPVTLQGRGSH